MAPSLWNTGGSSGRNEGTEGRRARSEGGPPARWHACTAAPSWRSQAGSMLKLALPGKQGVGGGTRGIGEEGQDGGAGSGRNGSTGGGAFRLREGKRWGSGEREGMGGNSPLLGGSFLASYPPLTHMLKFSRFARLSSCHRRRSFPITPTPLAGTTSGCSCSLPSVGHPPTRCVRQRRPRSGAQVHISNASPAA